VPGLAPAPGPASHGRHGGSKVRVLVAEIPGRDTQHDEMRLTVASHRRFADRPIDCRIAGRLLIIERRLLAVATNSGACPEHPVLTLSIAYPGVPV
jgi:hypothetical protein